MPHAPLTTNTLFYGDNLDILRSYIADASVDLIYLDPPFNAARNFNVLFRDEKGVASEAQIQAFTDTWKWSADAQATYDELVLRGDELGQAIEALRVITGRTSPMTAYLVTMAIRLAELHRVLKPTGSLYLHCDPTASHYLKIILDSIFGPQNFRSEIIWRRSNAHNKTTKQYGPIHDTILFYSKTNDFHFTPGARPAMKGYIDEWFTGKDKDGRPYRTNMLTGPGTRQGASGKAWRGFNPTSVGRHWAIPKSVQNDLPPEAEAWDTQEVLEYLYEHKLIYIPRDGKGQPKYFQYVGQGTPYQDIWAYQPYTQGGLYESTEAIDEDVRWLEHSKERLGYPTQKPLGLLERMINTSSNAGDVVLDPFCGCGTSIAAAQKLGRKWLGIDVTHLAIAAIRGRMEQMFPGIKYKVIGEPEDLGGARALAESGPDGRYQFQWWALSALKAMPLGGQAGSKEGKKGADRGIDGQITFIDDATGKSKRVLVQVKSGHVNAATIRDLVGTVQRENAAIGVLLTLEPPSAPMLNEALAAGSYHSPGWNRSYPKIQIVSIEQLLHGKQVEMPPTHMTFKQAPRVQVQPGQQLGLGMDGDE